MILHWELTIYPISYDDGIGRKVGKSPSMPKLIGKWSAQRLQEFKALVCLTLLGASAKFQAVTKVNLGSSVVTKTAQTQGVLIMKRSSLGLRAKTKIGVEDEWLYAHIDSSGAKEGGMKRKNCAETREILMGSMACAQCAVEGLKYKCASTKSEAMPIEDVGGGHSSDDPKDIITFGERRASALNDDSMLRRDA